MKGKIFLVGAGPGDPELLTIKAMKILQIADVVFYDHLVSSEILGHCKTGVELIYVGKQKNCHTVPQEKINSLLVEYANEFRTVVRLKGGDPSVFGRVGEEYEYAIKCGVECEIIPGITAGLGASASIGMPLTHRDYSSEIIFITGHKKEGKNYEAFSEIDFQGKTYVIYMGLSSLEEITTEILKNPSHDSLPMAIVENATCKNERVLVGRADTILNIARKENLQGPALLIIGDVIKFYEATRINSLKNQLLK